MKRRTAIVATLALISMVGVAIAAPPDSIDQLATAHEQAERLALATPSSGPGTPAASCRQEDVIAAIESASVGGRVDIPAGNCSWNGLDIDKAVHLRGAGRGLTNVAVSSSQVTKQAAGVTRISDISFNRAGGGNAAKAFRVGGSWLDAQQVVFERNDFDVTSSGLFRVEVVGGVIFANNTFTGGWDDSFIQLATPNDTESWQNADSLGDRDTDGRRNIYIEANTFYGGTNQAIDCDSAARCVYRHNAATYSSFNSHGRSTGPQGLRHFEVYANRFVHLGGTEQLASQNWAVWIRGGTGVIFDNRFDDIAGSHWGDKSEIKLSIRGAEDVRPQGSCADTVYPVPQQLGQNHDGTGAFTDPIYLWGNTGTVAIDAGWKWGNPCGKSFSDFFAWGRDGINDGTARPGYNSFTYPHPLRTD